MLTLSELAWSRNGQILGLVFRAVGKGSPSGVRERMSISRIDSEFWKRNNWCF